jgi:superfamily II RNA helicase
MTFLNIPNLSQLPQELPEHPYTFPLDPFQQHAITAISRNENVLVCAKTGSGKTLVGEYQIYHSLKKGKRVFYTTPIKSLSNQKFYDLKHQFQDATVGIMTGDIKFCPDAQIVIMTTEILRNLLYKLGTTTESLGLTASISMDKVDAIIFDECHYINDKDRGKIWEETMILLPPEINLVLLSATLNKPEYFAEWLGQLKQKPIHLIQTQYRIVPLVHNLLTIKGVSLTPEYTLQPLMDAKEIYNEKVYLDWLKHLKDQEDQIKLYKKQVSDARKAGVEGAIDGKPQQYTFIHKMNETIKVLNNEGNLPALFFVLSRKQCELYASKVEGTLLSTSDTSAVKHIISFHLHRFNSVLSTLPQYHQIVSLLERGIAFHHSGLLPLLKEIVEVLFSKGFVRIMFCTETFAVGLNMPTKTVLFAGLKKFDEQTGGMRMLRTDEYTQMAGRAGRRGKDTQGIVIYLPDKEPVNSQEMKAMMTGSKPPILSRMNFHYDFILKTLQSPSTNWEKIMKNSYWFQQRQDEIIYSKKRLLELNNKINKINLEDVFMKGCELREELENKHKQSVNSAKKETQRQLDSLKNKQMGPKWTQAWILYKELKELNNQRDEVQQYINNLEALQDTILPKCKFLKGIDYLTNDNPCTLKNEDITLKGILATEINEGHQILMTELYIRELLHSVSGEEIVAVLACFIEEKESDNPIQLRELCISEKAYDILCNIQNLSEEFSKKEYEIIQEEFDDKYWKIGFEYVEPMWRWINGENASVICQDYGIFEGNFIRIVMKMSNMLEEWLSLATYCQHTEQIDKIINVQKKLIRDIVISDSLYLRL